jgi:hypothetical protein
MLASLANARPSAGVDPGSRRLALRAVHFV